MIESLNQVEVIYLISTLLVIFLFFNFLSSISKTLNIFDEPNEKRKIHLDRIPSIGGFLFFSIFFIY